MPIRPSSRSSRPGWVPRIISPAPGSGPSRDWFEPGVRRHGRRQAAISMFGPWPMPVAGTWSTNTSSQNEPDAVDPAMRHALLLRNRPAAPTHPGGQSRSRRRDRACSSCRGSLSRFYRLKAWAEMNRIYRDRPKLYVTPVIRKSRIPSTDSCQAGNRSRGWRVAERETKNS